ncbi:MAG: hypothetical protein ACO3IB_06095 [Phycisphaerales bacterium]
MRPAGASASSKSRSIGLRFAVRSRSMKASPAAELHARDARAVLAAVVLLLHEEVEPAQAPQRVAALALEP